MSFIRLTTLIGLSYREVINLYTLHHKNIFPTETLCQNIFLTKISESEFFFSFYKSNDNDALFNQSWWLNSKSLNYHVKKIQQTMEIWSKLIFWAMTIEEDNFVANYA